MKIEVADAVVTCLRCGATGERLIHSVQKNDYGGGTLRDRTFPADAFLCDSSQHPTGWARFGGVDGFGRGLLCAECLLRWAVVIDGFLSEVRPPVHVFTRDDIGCPVPPAPPGCRCGRTMLCTVIEEESSGSEVWVDFVWECPVCRSNTGQRVPVVGSGAWAFVGHGCRRVWLNLSGQFA